MLESLSSPGRRAAEPSRLAALQTIALLRVGSGLVLFLQYGLEAAIRAWGYIWQHKEWSLITSAAASGVPFSQIVVPAAAFIVAAVSVAWMLGFFTRLFAVLLLPVLPVAIAVAEKQNWDGQSTVGWLLIMISLTLMLFGSGNLSVDGLFSMAASMKPRRRR